MALDIEVSGIGLRGGMMAQDVEARYSALLEVCFLLSTSPCGHLTPDLTIFTSLLFDPSYWSYNWDFVIMLITRHRGWWISCWLNCYSHVLVEIYSASLLFFSSWKRAQCCRSGMCPSTLLCYLSSLYDSSWRISCFSRRGDGTYKVQTFDLSLFCEDAYTVEPSALRFLNEHGSVSWR